MQESRSATLVGFTSSCTASIDLRQRRTRVSDPGTVELAIWRKKTHKFWFSFWKYVEGSFLKCSYVQKEEAKECKWNEGATKAEQGKATSPNCTLKGSWTATGETKLIRAKLIDMHQISDISRWTTVWRQGTKEAAWRWRWCWAPILSRRCSSPTSNTASRWLPLSCSSKKHLYFKVLMAQLKSPEELHYTGLSLGDPMMGRGQDPTYAYLR